MSSLDETKNFAKLGEEEELHLMAYVELKGGHIEHIWFLDSGCSNNMCCDKTMFCDLEEDFRQQVKLGSDTRMLAMERGNVRLMVNRMIHIITGV